MTNKIQNTELKYRATSQISGKSDPSGALKRAKLHGNR
jgi:hypothetical protein